jgi:hypothetical protein
VCFVHGKCVCAFGVHISFHSPSFEHNQILRRDASVAPLVFLPVALLVFLVVALLVFLHASSLAAAIASLVFLHASSLAAAVASLVFLPVSSLVAAVAQVPSVVVVVASVLVLVASTFQYSYSCMAIRCYYRSASTFWNSLT